MPKQNMGELFYKHFSWAACFLGLWITLVQARIKIVSIPETPVEGQNVTFSVENVQGDIREVSWFRGMASQGSTRVFSYFPGNGRPQRNGVQFTNREFGFPNGSLLITGIRPSDAGRYNVIILLRPKEILNASTDLQLATPSLTTATTATTATIATPPIKELPPRPSMVGWIVAGVLVGILLCGALGAVMVYRFVLQKSEPGTGVAGKLDLRAKKPPASKHDDKEPIYEVMDSPVETPKGPLPISGPLPPLPGTCLKLDSNYMDLLYKADSVYSEIKR
ncbi:carcinoembryonic antigen-related cell adhesion molecule 19 isoform X2 [Python bivittatus]|uniref:Carcinoembryonic antigen-related cell adhesion molecule 19 isoform X2 n=1 Tax=Python bivittatus TaxID=176946 RepID=A0A9F5N039_PYTBI|nr:carcinoembryonic antigen-related cell adhesion molecule 19 isoform X2 [Python bivittatus]